MRRVLTALLTAALLVHATTGTAGELLVSAAASLTNAVAEVTAAFEEDHPGEAVACNFAGSGTLLRQLELGAPVDVFLTADGAIMDRAQEAGLVRAETRRVFATNTLVLIARADLEHSGSGRPAEDILARDALLLAVGNPLFVPAGRYARQALGMARWERLQPRLVLGNSVRQVLDYVARGEVDAGVVYTTDATAAAERVWMVGELSGHDLVHYTAAVVASSTQPALAWRFTAFLSAGRGRAILARHDFGPPPAAAGAWVPQTGETQTEWTAWISR